MALVDYLERVSCAKVSSKVIVIGATLGKISEYTTNCTRYRAGRG
jgi:hypothetical protein